MDIANIVNNTLRNERDAARAEVDDVRRASFSRDVELRAQNKKLAAMVEQLEVARDGAEACAKAYKAQVAALREALDPITELFEINVIRLETKFPRGEDALDSEKQALASTAQAAAEHDARVAKKATDAAYTAMGMDSLRTHTERVRAAAIEECIAALDEPTGETSAIRARDVVIDRLRVLLVKP